MIRAEDIQVVIPSRKRIESCAVAMKLWANPIICVDESEEQDYKVLGGTIVTHPPVNGLSQLRQWILDNFKSKVVVMCDDDVTKMVTLVGRRFRKFTDPNAIMQITLNAANCAEGAGASLFSFGPSVVITHHTPMVPFRFTRIEASVFGMIGRRLRFDPHVRQHDDADITLQALLTDRIVWQDARFAPEHNFMTKPGGNSENRGKDRMTAELRYLTKKWGKFLRQTWRGQHVQGLKGRGIAEFSLSIRVQRRQPNVETFLGGVDGD